MIARLTIILLLVHFWGSQCFTIQTYTVLTQAIQINVRQNDFVRMSIHSISDSTFRGLLQIIQQQNQIIGRIVKDGVLLVNKPNLVTVFSGVDLKKQAPALGHSIDYLHNKQRQYICYDQYSGPFCLFKVSRANQIPNQNIKIKGYRAVLYFQQPINLSQILDQLTVKICKDSLLQKCKNYNKQERSFIQDAPFYLYIQKIQEKKQRNLKQQDLQVKWSKITVVSQQKGPKIVIQQEVLYSKQKFTFQLLFSILILGVILSKYLIKVRKVQIVKDTQKKEKQVSNSTQSFN